MIIKITSQLIKNKLVRYIKYKLIGIINYNNINTNNNVNHKRILSSSIHFVVVGPPSCNFVNPYSNMLIGHISTLCLVVYISPYSQSGGSAMFHSWSR